MRENEHMTDAFDLWLTKGLKRPQPVSPEFAQNVLKQIELLQMQKILRRVAWQERIYACAIAVGVIVGLGALCYIPLLQWVYSLVAEGVPAFINAIPESPKLSVTTLITILGCVTVLGGVLLDRLVSEQ